MVIIIYLLLNEFFIVTMLSWIKPIYSVRKEFYKNDFEADVPKMCNIKYYNNLLI